MKRVFILKTKQIQKFLSNKRAVSVALSTLIISAAVIAAGISVLYWAYSWGDIANHQYSEIVTSNQNAASERLSFEYTGYASGKLSVYLINCGQVDGVAIARVYVWDSNGQIMGTYPTESSPISPLMYIGSNTAISGNALDKGEEGYFSINNLSLNSGYYTVRVISERGRSYDSSISV
jgi:hypothetical protein